MDRLDDRKQVGRLPNRGSDVRVIQKQAKLVQERHLGSSLPITEKRTWSTGRRPTFEMADLRRRGRPRLPAAKAAVSLVASVPLIGIAGAAVPWGASENLPAVG